MKPIHSYVIRIYRREADIVAGVIEDVRTERSTSFKSIADLWQVLTGKRRLPRRPRAVPVLPSHHPRPKGNGRGDHDGG